MTKYSYLYYSQLVFIILNTHFVKDKCQQFNQSNEMVVFILLTQAFLTFEMFYQWLELVFKLLLPLSQSLSLSLSLSLTHTHTLSLSLIYQKKKRRILVQTSSPESPSEFNPFCLEATQPAVGNDRTVGKFFDAFVCVMFDVFKPFQGHRDQRLKQINEKYFFEAQRLQLKI